MEISPPLYTNKHTVSKLLPLSRTRDVKIVSPDPSMIEKTTWLSMLRLHTKIFNRIIIITSVETMEAIPSPSGGTYGSNIEPVMGKGEQYF